MPTPVIRWNIRPIATASVNFKSTDVSWPSDDPEIQTVKLGSELEFDVKYKWKDPYNCTARFQFKVEYQGFDQPLGTEETAWASILDEVSFGAGTCDGSWHSSTKSYRIPINHKVTRFKVSLRVLRGGALADDAGSGYDASWTSWEHREYTVYVDYFGDFSLDYIPVTLLYCPPSQDMVNGLKQSTQYETRVCFGFKEQVGSRSSGRYTLDGGVTIAGTNMGGGTGSEDVQDQSVTNAQSNMIKLSYEWQTNLLADNQRMIGRRYWGPLGDIFVLLKNPWFSVHGNESGEFLIDASERSQCSTELIIVPACKLLRPGDDPVASRIPADCRRRMLELDPFIQNLDSFFPTDQGLPLESAANPYQDPSVGNAETDTGLNRAARLTRLSLSTGVEWDVDRTESIQVLNSRVNETVYYAGVSEISNSQGGFGVNFFFAGVDLGIAGSSQTGHYTSVSYQRSNEAQFGWILTAYCKLCRNQNEADLSDLELWWDKHFSTFMFRRVPPCSPPPDSAQGTEEKPSACEVADVCGVVFDIEGLPLGNALVAITQGKLKLYTTTDQNGQFQFRRLRTGVYEINCGDRNLEFAVGDKEVKLARAFLKLDRVRRNITPRSSLWEVMDALKLNVKLTRDLQKRITKRGFSVATFNTALADLKIPRTSIESFRVEPKAVSIRRPHSDR